MQSRSGELALRPLPAVLLDLHEEIATGRLTLRRGRVSKSVDLVNGNPVSTASTPRDETLGHFLVTSGVITEDQHREAIQRAATVGGKLGEALVALRMLTVEQLIDQLGKQARHKLVQALRWPQGAWRFDAGGDAVEGMQLRMVDIVLGGLKETGLEDLTRLERLDGMSFELSERGKRLRVELRKTFGDRGVGALTTGASIGDLEKVFGDRVQARVAVDAMLMSDAIVARGAQLGMGAQPAKATLLGLGPVQLDAPEPPKGAGLYDMVFELDGADAEPTPVLEAPDLEYGDLVEIHDEDSGVVSTADLQDLHSHHTRTTTARQLIVAEHQRIQGADHYAVLLVDRDGDAEDVDAAHQFKLEMLEQKTAGTTDPQDQGKLEQIIAAYAVAKDVLLDPDRRAAYDRELAGGERGASPPAIDTEINFRSAEELIKKGVWAQAILLLKAVIARSPGEADYHAALGWAQFQQAEAAGTGADGALAALDHLNHALSIDPDHAAAHEYKGRIDAALKVDDTGALFHLERALDLDPNRVDALATIEQLLISHGELRRLERILKRLVFRLRGSAGAAEANAWVRIVKLYSEHLDDPAGLAAALASAKKHAPEHPEIAKVGDRSERHRRATHPPRTGWREALLDSVAGAQLVQRTIASGQRDAAFLAASTMVALGTADDAMGALYDEQRPKKLVVPPGALSQDQWSLVRHKEDGVELGGLLELVAPAIHALAPMRLVDGDLDDSQRVGDGELPPAFARVKKQLTVVLGIGGGVPVYTRRELGTQIHVVAADPPVLAAGDEALTAAEGPDLAFRLSRAMTFLWPGRAVGASRPGRVLKAVVLAIVREAAGTDLGKDEPLATAAEAAIAGLPPATRAQARAAALRILSKAGGGLNLSAWARSLSRTADRVGMLLCGDVPAAFAGARDMGDLDKDLVEFAFSAAHVSLRGQLGLGRP